VFALCFACCSQVCIDLFMLSQAYTDIATLSTLSHTTGGSLYHYCPFTPLMDQDQLLNDLKWNVNRPQVGTCVLAGELGVPALRCPALCMLTCSCDPAQPSQPAVSSIRHTVLVPVRCLTP
jgi:hypothetical protein